MKKGIWCPVCKDKIRKGWYCSHEVPSLMARVYWENPPRTCVYPDDIAGLTFDGIIPPDRIGKLMLLRKIMADKCPECEKMLDAFVPHTHYIGDVCVGYLAADDAQKLPRITTAWSPYSRHPPIDFDGLVSLKRLEKLLLLS